MKKFLNVFLTDFEDGICSGKFLLVVIGAVLILAISTSGFYNFSELQIKEGIDAQFHFQVILEGMKSEVFVFALPLLSGFPFAGRFLEEQEYGYLKQSLPRSGRGNYIVSKVATTAIGSGISIFIGIWIACGVLFLLFSPMEISMGKEVESLFSQVFKNSLVISLLGSLWGNIGACFAIGFHNKYMAYSGSFLVSYLLIIIFTRYFPGVYVLNPREWINPQNDWGNSIFGILGNLIELSILSMLLHGRLLSKQIRIT